MAYLLTFVGMATVGMVAFFIAMWLNNSLGAVGGAVMLLFTMLIIGEIGYFKPIKEYLFSSHLLVGGKAFLDPIPWSEIGSALICLGVYIVVLSSASMLIFRRKDILA